jgi:hypothetical protein
MTKPKSKKPDHLPSQLHFDIGGFMRACHEINFNAGEIHYRHAPGAYMWEPEIIFQPDQKRWEEFWRAADTAAVWKWARS